MREGGLRTKSEPSAPPPGVSIVTVVYNGAATLERTILSVLGQDHQGLEYIIVDGGSSDGTVEVIRKYEDRLAYWCSAKDHGIYDAMNKGVALATGQWVGLINADDAYAEGAVAMAMRAVAGKEHINIVHGDILVEYPSGAKKVKHAKRSSFLLKYWEMVLNHPSFFVRRSYYSGRPFDASFRVSADHLWTYRAWREAPGQFLYVPRVFACFTAGGASMSGSYGRMLKESDRMSEVLGFTKAERLLARTVRAVLYWPGMAKLWFNQLVAPLQGKRKP
ncbi:MAG: glycosyltransferase [Flavobacteriales bacterium]|nr:glycosyltransferase [Flavobacteriales bacterium]MBP9079483.1 glycosyltransferase [Flavobacteriales bacterium]